MKPPSRRKVVDAAARAMHEAVRSFRIALGDGSVPPWSPLPQAAKDQALADAESAITGASARSLHAAWKLRRSNAGWTHGERLDSELMTDPSMCQWDALTETERREFELRRSVALALGVALGASAPSGGAGVVVGRGPRR